VLLVLLRPEQGGKGVAAVEAPGDGEKRKKGGFLAARESYLVCASENSGRAEE